MAAAAVMSTSRFSFANFPVAYDPQMRREDAVTLARTASQQNGIPKVTGKEKEKPSKVTPAMAHAAPSNASLKQSPEAPKRKHFVFADPVAFRCVMPFC